MIFTYPLGIFQGILLEYLALKYSPQVVYMDLRDFLVTGYIPIYIGGCALAYPCVKSKSIAYKKKISHKYSRGVALDLTRVALGYRLLWLEVG